MFIPKKRIITRTVKTQEVLFGKIIFIRKFLMSQVAAASRALEKN
jgi:hypothetical protein